VQLPADTEASIVSDGLLGSKYVNLIPGHASDRIPAGGKIAKTRDFQSLEDMVGQVIFLATQTPDNKPASDQGVDQGAAPAAPGTPPPVPQDAPQ